MDLNERLEFCRVCQNRKIDFKIGLVCSLTQEKPDFLEVCQSFIKDEKEADRVLKLKLAGAGNARSQEGSLNPQKNINYGVFLAVSGVLVFLFFSALFGIIITFGGISFFVRGKQQQKILAKNEELNRKINKVN